MSTTNQEMGTKILRGMRAYFDDPAKWTQGAYARDANGGSTGFANPEATCHCLIGGRDLIARRLNASDQAAQEARITLLGVISTHQSEPCDAVDAWNDAKWRTHADILEVLDMAILVSESPDP